MSNETKDEYLAAITDRYRKAGRKYKKLILDEFCRVWGAAPEARHSVAQE